MVGFFEEYAKYSTPPMYDLSEMTPEEGKGMMRTMLDSATIVGLGGEIEAGIRAPFSDKNFQEIDSQINKEQAAYKEKYPNEYTAFSGLGAGSTIMASAPAAITRVVGTGLAKNVGASTVLGALGGFFSGTGEGETTEERIQSGKEEIAPMAVGSGLATTFILGAMKASPPVIKFLSNMAKKVMSK
tara:strand:- start:30 stop:587 length:558 start_codon:yes stop_codon:yes gene_type:complete